MIDVKSTIKTLEKWGFTKVEVSGYYIEYHLESPCYLTAVINESAQTVSIIGLTWQTYGDSVEFEEVLKRVIGLEIHRIR